MSVFIYNGILVSTLLFIIGLWGIFMTRKNLILILISIELMLLAINMNFIIFSTYFDHLAGQIFALFILTVAAAESAIGLAIVVVYYRLRGLLAIDMISAMKG